MTFWGFPGLIFLSFLIACSKGSLGRLKSRADKRQLCLTPRVVWMGSEYSELISITDNVFLYMDFIRLKVVGQMDILSIISSIYSLSTQSNAFVKSRAHIISFFDNSVAFCSLFVETARMSRLGKSAYWWLLIKTLQIGWTRLASTWDKIFWSEFIRLTGRRPETFKAQFCFLGRSLIIVICGDEMWILFLTISFNKWVSRGTKKLENFL